MVSHQNTDPKNPFVNERITNKLLITCFDDVGGVSFVPLPQVPDDKDHQGE
jgi:hypothetical protein